MRKKSIHPFLASLLLISLPMVGFKSVKESLNHLIELAIQKSGNDVQKAFDNFETLVDQDDEIKELHELVEAEMDGEENKSFDGYCYIRFAEKGAKFKNADIADALEYDLCMIDNQLKLKPKHSTEVVEVMIRHSDQTYRDLLNLSGKEETLFDYMQKELDRLELAKKDVGFTPDELKEIEEEIQYFSKVKCALEERAQRDNPVQSISTGLGYVWKLFIGAGAVGTVAWLSYMSLKQYKKWKAKKVAKSSKEKPF